EEARRRPPSADCSLILVISAVAFPFQLTDRLDEFLHGWLADLELDAARGLVLLSTGFGFNRDLRRRVHLHRRDGGDRGVNLVASRLPLDLHLRFEHLVAGDAFTALETGLTLSCSLADQRALDISSRGRRCVP